MKARKKTATARPVAVPPPVPGKWRPKILRSEDHLDELNPAIIEELEPAQAETLRTAADRLDESTGETARRLVGLALFLTGLDPASEDEAVEVLRKILGEDEKATDVINRFLLAETTARGLSHARERLDRVEFLKERQAELERLAAGA